MDTGVKWYHHLNNVCASIKSEVDNTPEMVDKTELARTLEEFLQHRKVLESAMEKAHVTHFKPSPILAAKQLGPDPSPEALLTYYTNEQYTLTPNPEWATQERQRNESMVLSRLRPQHLQQAMTAAAGAPPQPPPPPPPPPPADPSLASSEEHDKLVIYEYHKAPVGLPVYLHIIPHTSADYIENKLSLCLEAWLKRYKNEDTACGLHTRYATSKLGKDENIKRMVHHYRWEMAHLRLTQSAATHDTLAILDNAALFPRGPYNEDQAPATLKILPAFSPVTLLRTAGLLAARMLDDLARVSGSHMRHEFRKTRIALANILVLHNQYYEFTRGNVEIRPHSHLPPRAPRAEQRAEQPTAAEQPTPAIQPSAAEQPTPAIQPTQGPQAPTPPTTGQIRGRGDLRGIGFEGNPAPPKDAEGQPIVTEPAFVQGQNLSGHQEPEARRPQEGQGESVIHTVIDIGTESQAPRAPRRGNEYPPPPGPGNTPPASPRRPRQPTGNQNHLPHPNLAAHQATLPKKQLEAGTRGLYTFFPNAPEQFTTWAAFFGYQIPDIPVEHMQRLYPDQLVQSQLQKKIYTPKVDPEKRIDETLSTAKEFNAWMTQVFDKRTNQDAVLWRRKDIQTTTIASFMTDALRDLVMSKIGLPAIWEHQSKWGTMHFMANMAGFYEWMIWLLNKYCRPIQLTETKRFLEILHYATVAPDAHNASLVIEKIIHAGEELEKRGCGRGTRDIIEQVQRALRYCDDRKLKQASLEYRINDDQEVDGVVVGAIMDYTFLDEKPRPGEVLPDGSIDWNKRFTRFKACMSLELRKCKAVQKDVDPNLHPIYIKNWKIVGASANTYGIAVPGDSSLLRPSTNRRDYNEQKNSPDSRRKYSRGRANRDKKNAEKRPRSRSRDRADNRDRRDSYDRNPRPRYAPKHHGAPSDKPRRQVYAHDPKRTKEPTLAEMLDWFSQRGPVCIACGSNEHKVDHCHIKAAHFPTFNPPWKQLKELKVYNITAAQVLPSDGKPRDDAQPPAAQNTNFGSRYSHMDSDKSNRGRSPGRSYGEGSESRGRSRSQSRSFNTNRSQRSYSTGGQGNQ
jgi:hypothetical protein